MISKLEADQIQARLAANRAGGIRKGRNAPLTPLASEVAAAKVERGQEIKTLHEPFEQWCRLNGIIPIHSRPDKAATIAKGFPDFALLKGPFCAVVEFKALANPEAGMSPEQLNWRDTLTFAGVPYLLTNSLAGAIEFAKMNLHLYDFGC